MSDRRVTIDLWCALDDEEQLQRARSMTTASAELENLERVRADWMKAHKEQVKEQEGIVRSMSIQVRDRRERRPVDCVVQFHMPVQGTKRTVRLDTGEFVRDEPMSSYEMQENLFAPASDEDELYDDAVRLVFEFGKASTSMLQRRLRIGYGRASGLVDAMERAGLVGPADGSKTRELLKRPEAEQSALLPERKESAGEPAEKVEAAPQWHAEPGSEEE